MTEDERKAAQAKFEEEAAKAPRGDLSIRGFWRRQTRCIIDVRLTDTDQPSYVGKKVESVLLLHEREKKGKYLEDCIEARKDFTPFISSVDGVLSREAHLFIKQLIRFQFQKWDKTIMEVSNYIYTRLSLAILKATHQCLRGARVSKRKDDGRGIGDDGSSIGLYRTSEC